MPKVKSSVREKLRCYIREFGEKIFSTDGVILYCQLCEVKVTAEKRFTVQQHCNTAKHKNCLNRQFASESRQLLLFQNSADISTSSRNTSEFSKDLCSMMVECNIPLKKLNNESFLRFLEKYTSHPVPNESTLRKNYLQGCYEDVLDKIRSSVGDNKIWVSIDETTDVDGRYIANVIVGILKEYAPGEIFVLTCEQLERTNHSTIAVLFDNSMKLLWPSGVKRDNILLFLTDAAPYMIKAAKGLKMFYPRMIHVTCLAHAIHRVAEEVRSNYPEVDKLVSNTKKIFTKAHIRVQKFKDEAPSLPLPPQPILTRWCTWLDAAVYYCKNYDTVKKIIDSFDPSEASSIKIAQDLFTSTTLKNDLVYLKSNFGFLSSKITQLENSGTPLSDAVDIVKYTEQELKQAKGTVAAKVCSKFVNVLEKNPGFFQLCSISDILCGKNPADFKHEFSLCDITFFKYAPITSCDVERSFSRYKTILSDNRRGFSFDNLKMHVVISCNN